MSLWTGEPLSNCVLLLLCITVTAEVLSATALDFSETKGKCWELHCRVGVTPTLA